MLQVIYSAGQFIRNIRRRIAWVPPAKVENQLALLVAQVPTGVAIFDTEMRYLAVSRCFLSDMARLGLAEAFDPAEVIDRSLYETCPSFPPHLREVNVRVLAGEKLAQQKELLWRQDGCIDWIRWSAEPWRTADGRIGGAVVFGEIITEQVQAKRALAESEARFRATFENAAVGIAHIDPDLRWLRANEVLCRIVGWPINELVTKSLDDITLPDDREASLGYVHQMRQGQIDNFDVEKRSLRKDGGIVWTKRTVSCIRKCDGSIDYLVAVIQDVSARKRAEELLRRQAELLNQSHDAIFTWKIGGGITYWSRGAEAMYGYTAADAIGCDPHELLQTRSNLPMHEIEAQIAGSGSWYGELTHTTRDGCELVVESSHVRVFYDSQMHALETNRDITARKHAEEQVHFLMREANHRVKNTLSLVQVMARQTVAYEPNDFLNSFTQRIRALAADHDLLIKNQWRGADLGELVRTQIAHFTDVVGSRITPHGPKLRLNATAVQSIGLALHELATNASKYGALSTDAGRIDVSWQLDGDTFRMRWIERGGPPVQSPERRGFGSTVIDSMVKGSLNGEVQLDYEQSGLEWRLTCQAAEALEQGSGSYNN